MRTSSSRRVRRGLASFLAAALAAGLTVAGAGVPAQAAPESVTGGSLTWGYAADYRADLPAGPATRAASGGASFVGDLATFPASTTSTWDGTDGTLEFSGDVRIGYAAGPSGNYLTLANPVVRITGSSGTLSALSSGKSHGVQPDAPSAVRTLANLDLSEAQRTDTASSVTWTGIRTTVAAEGQAALVTLRSGDAALRPVGEQLDPLSITLTKIAPAVQTATTLAVDPTGASVAGSAVTLTATVAPAAAGAVEFRDGGTALGTAPVSGGVARLETTTLAAGAHELTAAFEPADPAAFVASASGAVVHTVTEPATEPEPDPVADPVVTVSPSTPVDPTVDTTFTVSGTGFVGAGAANGAYVLLGEKSIWSGDGPLVSSGWLAQGWVMPQQVRAGAFTTTLTVAAGKLDPAKEYVVATSAAHGFSATDRSLDTFTPVAVQQPEPQEPVSAPFPQIAEPGTTHGTVSWKVSDRVFSYYNDKQVTGGVTADGAFRFPVAAVERSGSDTDLTLSGALRLTWKNTYAGNTPFYWLQLEDVTARVDGTGRGVLSAAVSWDNLTDAAGSSAATRLDVATFTVDPEALGTGRVLVTSSAQQYTDALLAYLEPTGQRAHFVASGPNDANAEAKKTAPITLAFGEDEAPAWEPAIDVYAADGSTPLGDTPVQVGETIVVKGSGFDPAANVGGRGVPIPAHLPQGTYVVFGSFAEQWRPSEGAAGAVRKVGSQSWALARSVLDQVPAQYQGAIRAAWTEISEDGTFEARLVVKNPAALEGGRYGVYTYPASSVVNAAQELYVPVSYDAPAPLTVTPASTAVVAGSSVTLTVGGLVDGDAIKDVTLGGAKATYTRQGGTVVLTVPADAVAGSTAVVVTSDLGVTGSATLTVTAPPVVEPPVDPEPTVPTTVGSLSWGVRGSFVDYIQGPIAKGGATASAGASVSGKAFTFRQSTPWAAPATGTSTGYRGTVQFSGHDGLLSLTVSDPRVRVDGPRAATLVLDVTSSNLDGTTFAAKGVKFATLALPAPTTAKDGAVTYVDAAATLTAAGSAAFSGFYGAGEALAPVTFTVGAPTPTTGGGGDGGTIGTPGTGTPGTPTDPAKATLSVSQAAPGDEVTISGIGFGAHEAGIRTEIRSTPRTLATGVSANAGGAATSTVTIPNDVAPGEHTLLLIGEDHTASAPITIVGAGTTGTGTGSGSAAEQCFAQGVNGATLSWGVSDRFRAYVTGPIAKGSVSTDGVRDGGSAFTWSGGKGSFNTDLGKGRASFGGSVSFSGHEGILDLRISNPRVVVNGSSGTLVVDVRSSDMEGNTSSSNGVAFASLDLSGKKSTSGSTITWSGAPATLTAAGATAFAGFYEAGTALSPVTFAFPIGGDVECDAYSGALATTGSDSGSLALLAGTLLLTGGAILAVRRRRAGRVQAVATA